MPIVETTKPVLPSAPSPVASSPKALEARKPTIAADQLTLAPKADTPAPPAPAKVRDPEPVRAEKPVLGHGLSLVGGVAAFVGFCLADSYLISGAFALGPGLIAVAVCAAGLAAVVGGQYVRDPGQKWWQAVLWGVGVNLAAWTVVPAVLMLFAGLAGGAAFVADGGRNHGGSTNIFR